jgi:hypothetical protein
MEQLTSCYFCGDAVDAAVEEYPLVRSGAFPEVDTDRRIYLCPSCRRKLTQVIEHVIEAAFEDGEAEDALAADRLRDVEMTATEVQSVGEDEDPLTATAADPAAASDTESDTADDGASTDEKAAAEATTDPPAADDAGADEPADEAVPEDGSADDTASETEDGGTDTETPFETAAADSEASAEAESEDGADEETPTGDGADAATRAAGAGDSGAAQSGRQETDGASTSDDDTDERERQYTKAEFNKVVRLLQNREFPVEIDELVVVAGSAYEIDEPTCHAIIDALIERDVVADNGEELVRA